MSFHEIGRMTLTLFNKMYQHYQQVWSMEMRLNRANMTYEEAKAKAREAEDWF